MAARIIFAGLSMVVVTLAQQQTLTPAPTTLAPTPAAKSTTASPTAIPTAANIRRPTPASSPRTPSSDESASAAPTEAHLAAPTPSPTVSKAPTQAPTPSPTPPPTFSDSDYCKRPYEWSNKPTCVELATPQDTESGVGAFYDEEDCGADFSVVGCNFGDIPNCRVCVFHRELYVAVIPGVSQTSQVPFVDCPCCVPELYGVGGDIDCDFTNPALPIPATPSPTKAVKPATGATSEPDASRDQSISNSTMSPTVTPIPMEPCEKGAGGDTTDDSQLCVDVASMLDWANGIGVYYEEDCAGLGCNIAGNEDCRQCVFDRSAYTASGGAEALVDCPCCVPLTYKLYPEDSECVWPITPAPATDAEGNGGVSPRRRLEGAVAGPLAVALAAAASWFIGVMGVDR